MSSSPLRTLSGKKVDPRTKKLVVFDLDGTLTPTKATMDREMSGLLTSLLRVKKVSVIGGGKYQVFKAHFVRALRCPRPLLPNLSLFPTTATAFYRYHQGWRKVYALRLSRAERAQIKSSIREVLREAKYVPPRKVYGPVVEDRGTQITFSALGQDVVAMLGVKKGVALKEKWKRENTRVKLQIARRLARRLPKMAVRAAGYTSIDITRKGIDKAYGIRQIKKYIKVPVRQMLFIGDALFPGGNDHAALRSGVDCIEVRGPAETKKIIRTILASADAP